MIKPSVNMGMQELGNCPRLIVRTVVFIHELISGNSLGRNVASFIDVIMTYFAQEVARWNEHIVFGNELAAVAMRFRCARITLPTKSLFPKRRSCLGGCFFSQILLRRNKNVKKTTFLYVTPCSLVEVYRHFGGMYCVHLQGRRVSELCKK
jgi:hypothetical protein